MVESRIVIPVVVGSSPISHPNNQILSASFQLPPRRVLHGAHRLPPPHGARIDEAEKFAAALVEPVLAIFDAVLPLGFVIGGMRLRNLFLGGPVDIVDVHIQWHGNSRKCEPNVKSRDAL